MWSHARAAGLFPVHAAPWRLPGSISAVCHGPVCLQETQLLTHPGVREKKYALGPACVPPWNGIVQKMQQWVCVLSVLGNLRGTAGAADALRVQGAPSCKSKPSMPRSATRVEPGTLTVNIGRKPEKHTWYGHSDFCRRN